MRLNINLATRVYLNVRALNISVAAALALLSLFLIWNVWNMVGEFGEMKRLKEGIALLEQRAGSSKAHSVPEGEYNELLASIAFANDIIERKSFDWLSLLGKLEEVVPDGITIVSVDPTVRDSGLKLAGVAKKFNNLKNLLENLEDSRYFSDIYLVSQSDVQGKEGPDILGFSITCKARYK